MPSTNNPRPRKLVYENINDKKRASTFFSLASGELAAANELVNSKLYKAAVIHLYLCSTYLAQSSIADKITHSNTKSVDKLFNAKYGNGMGVIPKESSNIHGITNEKAIREGKDLDEILMLFFNALLRAKCLIAHNISFDEKIIESELIRAKKR